jgi:predicted NBD/HSP70 family sugar kinase
MQQRGCVEALAAGWAIARDLRKEAHQIHNSRDVIALLEKGERICIQRIREAGRVFGQVIAEAVSILNPEAIVMEERCPVPAIIFRPASKSSYFASACRWPLMALIFVCAFR